MFYVVGFSRSMFCCIDYVNLKYFKPFKRFMVIRLPVTTYTS